MSSPSATTRGRGIEQFVVRQPLTMRWLINATRRCRWFRSDQFKPKGSMIGQRSGVFGR